MALTWDQVSGITEKKFLPKLYDNVFITSALLDRLKKKSYKKIDGGTSIMIPLEYDDLSSAGWFTGADVLSTSDNETLTAAEYAWKQMYANVTITRLDELKNSGDSQKVDLVKSKMKNAEKTMGQNLATGIYNAGTTTNAIIGLQAIAAVSNTIGGISQTSYSWWQAQLDSTTTAFSIAALQSRFSACSFNNESPTVVMATKANYNRYFAALQPQQRFMDSDSAKGGFQSLMFNGIPFLADDYAPTDNIIFINENYLHLCVHKDEDMRFSGFQKPENQNIRLGQVFWMGALGSSNNRMHGRLSAVAS
jgi:hypothetical protein